MYYYINGKLAYKGENYVVIDVGGVGYKIFTSLNSIESIGETGAQAMMYTHLNVREDAMDLFGFTTTEEREMFLHLTSVSGVGPKAALSILSVTTPAKFAIAVVTNDVKTITKAQGVGPKLAQRVILELKDKLKNEDLQLDEGDVYSESDNRTEAISALVVLGYAANEAKKAVDKLDGSMSVEDIIKQALTKLF